jgi:phosphatidylglycerophosphate synthase
MNTNYNVIKKIKSLQKRPDGIFGSFMTRPVSHYFAFIAYKLHISPNIVSFLSFLFCLVAGVLVLFSQSTSFLILTICCWWIGAILDAADGDLARFTEKGTPFGGWFDSFLDRLKEFLIFSIFGYLAWKRNNSNIFLLLGLISIFTTVMSGYISDTKKLFIKEKRKPEIVFSRKYSFGMVDTRDFVVIVSLALNEMRIALIIYSTIFLILVILQTGKFIIEYGGKK